MKIYESRFYNFALCDETNSLVFQWKEDTKSMNNNDFREALSNYAGYGFECARANMLVDVRSFCPPEGVPDEESMGAFRTDIVVPRYNKAGIKKFAYLKNPGAPGMPVSPPTQHAGEEFETAVFDSEDSVKEWLKT